MFATFFLSLSRKLLPQGKTNPSFFGGPRKKIFFPFLKLGSPFLFFSNATFLKKTQLSFPGPPQTVIERGIYSPGTRKNPLLTTSRSFLGLVGKCFQAWFLSGTETKTSLGIDLLSTFFLLKTLKEPFFPALRFRKGEIFGPAPDPLHLDRFFCFLFFSSRSPLGLFFFLAVWGGPIHSQIGFSLCVFLPHSFYNFFWF